uniref:Protein aurora borealis n=1 Tax=Angiostrongylus cantonensis TaxID=6313 RepID=A0A0K0D290_ANGCA
LKLSPIFCDGERRTVFSKRMVEYKYRGESPFRSFIVVFQWYRTNGMNFDPSTSRFMFRDMSTETAPHTRSTNSFESRLLETLHTNTFSPSVFFLYASILQFYEFKWSIEELSILKPVHITEEEIAQSNQSPDPEHEAKIQSILDEYWKNNICHIPSPDAPNPLVTAASETPLCDIVRISAAMRMKYSTSSPKSRPNLNGSLVQSARNRHSQTEITIAPSAFFDFTKFLGKATVEVLVFSSYSSISERHCFSIWGVHGSPSYEGSRAG